MLESYALLSPPTNFLFETFDRKLQQYIEADLINYNVRAWKEKLNFKRFQTFKEPFAVLTLAELEAGFVICVTPLVLSVFVFLAEWIPTLKNLIVFHIIFKKYFERKELEQKIRSEIIKAKITKAQILSGANHR